jgi:hypothetical protein
MLVGPRGNVAIRNIAYGTPVYQINSAGAFTTPYFDKRSKFISTPDTRN